MKKIFKTSLVLFGILSTLNANAGNEINPLDLKKTNGKKVSFTLNDKKKVKLSIYDSNDDLIFKENLSGNKLVRTYDLAEFPEGDYFIEAESDLKISKYKIEVKGKIATLSPEAVSEIFKPIFDYNSNSKKLEINLLNPENVPVIIKIYDSNSELLYSKTCTSNDFIKTYDLSKLKGEEYTVLVTYGDKTFQKTLSL
jgi:hypothetical protein